MCVCVCDCRYKPDKFCKNDSVTNLMDQNQKIDVAAAVCFVSTGGRQRLVTADTNRTDLRICSVTDLQDESVGNM